MRLWFDSLPKDGNLDIHQLSVGSGLENLLKEAPKDETLRRFCAPKHHFINPEEANTVEHDYGPMEEEDDDENMQ